MRQLILASQSRYRAEALENAGLVFSQIPANVDESAFEAADPGTLSADLALKKCLHVASDHPDAIVIGSDQVAWCANVRLSKPGTFEKACEQLSYCQGKEATFYTSVSVTAPDLTEALTATIPTKLKFRQLSHAEIAAYAHLDQPFDCAGSFKIEANGIHLFEYVDSVDPTALVGLPMLATLKFLREAGINPLTD